MSKILLIDNDKKRRQHCVNMLTHIGQSVVHETDTLYDLVDNCEKYKPEYIFVDILIEGSYYRRQFKSSLNSIIENLRAQNIRSKVIIMTQYNMEDTILSLLKSGANGYLFKPLSLNDVKDIFK